MSDFSSASARRGLSLIIAAGVLWGTGGLLGRLVADSAGLGPFAVAALRIGLGGAVLVGYVLATGDRVPRTRAAWRRITLTGLLAAGFQACYFVAVAATSVSLATLIAIGSAPVLVLLARPRAATRRQAAAAGLALVGLWLLVAGPGTAVTSDGASLLGSACALLAGAGFAALTLLGGRPVPGLGEAATTGFGFVLGGLALVPLAVLTATGPVHLDARSVLLVAALAVVPTALAYTCYFRGLRRTPAGVAAVLAMLEPLTGAVLASVLLGERLGATGLVAGVLLGLAMVLSARSAPRVPVRDGRARVRSS